MTLYFIQTLFCLSLSFISVLSVCTTSSQCSSDEKCMLGNCVLDVNCPNHAKFGPGPPSSSSCTQPSDPNNLPKSELENWFTKEAFEDLFPKANIGWGPNSCWPYSYESFIIAARYFPRFGTENPNNGYSKEENGRRDLAAFFSHAVQETGENDASLYAAGLSKDEADACFYRGGFFNWFEGGPTSGFLTPSSPGHSPEDGVACNNAGKYCSSSALIDYFFPCSQETSGTGTFNNKGCYFGRGAIQISYNYNYGYFNDWLKTVNIQGVDLLANPNLIMTKMDPPLAVLASLWFYMTPQPPKPAMHDIVMGEWEPGTENRKEGYEGPIFGPTSLIINNECGGEDPETPGGPGESRRIKAFKWFTSYFGVPIEADHLLTCKGMPKQLAQIPHRLSYQPDWSSTWKTDQACNCAPASYGGIIPYYDPGFYPQRFVDTNEKNREACVASLYGNPSMYGMDPASSPCLNVGISTTSSTPTTSTSTTTSSTTTTTTPTTTSSTTTTTTPTTTSSTTTTPATTTTTSTTTTSSTPSTTTTSTTSTSSTTSSTSTTTTTASPGSSPIQIIKLQTNTWIGGDNQRRIEFAVSLKNTGAAAACNIKLHMNLPSGKVDTFWGMDKGGDHFYVLPHWAPNIPAGGTVTNIGFIVANEVIPDFTVDYTVC